VLSRDAIRHLAARAVPLGLGEGVSRLCNFAVIAYIARYAGVEAIGIYGLAQTVAQYVMTGTDLGLKSVGARLVAVHPGAAALTERRVQAKRRSLAVACALGGALYAWLGPLPEAARYVVLAFAVAALPYAYTLDWVLWGAGRFARLGLWRAATGVAVAGMSVAGLWLTSGSLYAAALANGAGTALAAAALVLTDRLRRERGTPAPSPAAASAVTEETAWANVCGVGLAFVLNQIFHTADVLMLGALGATTELGLYNAADKIVVLLLGVYYLLAQSVFPDLAKRRSSAGEARWFLKCLLVVFLAGAALASLFALFAGDLIALVYGGGFAAAAPLLRVLLATVPPDFVAALLGTAFIAWGRPRRVLVPLAFAVAAGLAWNAYAIPRHGALGAAWGALFAYAVLLAGLLAAYVTSAAPSGRLARGQLTDSHR
jgi:O-antigen/teichoic acid export membrane protein